MSVKIEPSWEQRLGAEFDKPYFHQLCEQVRQEYYRTTMEEKELSIMVISEASLATAVPSPIDNPT